ncbi:6-hydroxymethylpterin diphosphokinase MptE-like protein [Marinomonas ostreistagni]|uniref:motility associated factor glycosyltransferase family protein n=1 Tax=Marinomonas ostreistagni TaxID=359209 RepID=UPI00194EF8E8|nr:6-hydroxymethylpterin diphosphokinase MptE-like protein [Marinomonas ostreistagni]MBM6551148.1 motility associated factor glycosyltransferase family protein [Marinomonas ostreistagni]
MFEQAVIESILQRIEAGRQRLVDNDDILSDRYRTNIEVLKQHFPDIYEVMKDYEPQNKNVFMESDGALNLFYPENNGSTVFSETPFKDIEQRYQAFCEKPNRTLLNVDANDRGLSRHEFYLTKISRMKSDLKAQHEKLTRVPDAMGAIVLFGFDFGYQLTRILDSHFVKHVYIYEENLDFFYYSLFAIDWQWIVDETLRRNTSLHFFLGLDHKTFIAQYMNRLRFNGLYLAAYTYLYFGYKIENVKDVFYEFHNQYGKQVMGWGFFDDGIIGIGQYLARKNKTLLAVEPKQDPKPGFNDKLDVPVFILGNGPSLDNHIEFIREYQDEAIIVSCGTTINTLQRYGIKPDFHVDVERLRQTVEKLAPLDKDFLKGITALTVNVIHPDFYQFFDRAVIGLKPSEPISSMMCLTDLVSEENRSRLMHMHFSAPLVANLAMSYVTQMGYSDIYLMGTDCGFRERGQHHSKLSGYYTKEGKDSGLARIDKSLIQREANYGGIAYTTSIMDVSRIQLEYAIRWAKKRNKLLRCYNLSDGVKIGEAAAISSDDLLILPKGKSFKDASKQYALEQITAAEPDNFDSRVIPGIQKDFAEFTEKVSELLDESFTDFEGLMLTLSKVNNHTLLQHNYGRPYLAELFYGSFVYFANEVLDYACNIEGFEVANVRKLFDVFQEFVREMPPMLENAKDYVDKRENIISDRYHA